MFAIVIRTKETRYYDGRVACKEDENYYLENGDWGILTREYNGVLGVNAFVLENEERAKEIAEKFECHPWWIVKKDYKIVKVDKIYKKVVDGYREVNENVKL